MRKVILSNGQSPGDLLVMTRAIKELNETFPDYMIDVRTPCPQIFENNPRLISLKNDDPEVEKFNIEYPEIHNSGWSGIHFTEAFIRDVENKLNVKLQRSGMLPEIWISDLEKTWINQVETEFGWVGPFWVINAGMKQDNELKNYHRWQEVANLFNEYFKDKVKLVQVGEKSHIHPELKGVLNLVGKTDLRQLIRLVYHAHGTVTPISFLTHLSAAFEQPAVIVAGAKESRRWECYQNQFYLATNGCVNCGIYDGCWLGGKLKNCKDLVSTDKGMVPRCFELIKPYQIIKAIKDYYEGGALPL